MTKTLILNQKSQFKNFSKIEFRSKIEILKNRASQIEKIVKPRPQVNLKNQSAPKITPQKNVRVPKNMQ
jgi:hypothetical protein